MCSAENALLIQAGKFIPSNSGGMLGPGIYFAPCPEKSAAYFRGGTFHDLVGAFD